MSLSKERRKSRGGGFGGRDGMKFPCPRRAGDSRRRSGSPATTCTSAEAADENLSLTPQSVDAKCKSALPVLIIRKIKRNVTDYYPHVQREFRALEQESPTKSQLIYSQVRTFYLKQKDLGLPKTEIYQNVVAWFQNVTKTDMIEAPEVIAAFFVQNCEVLD